MLELPSVSLDVRYSYDLIEEDRVTRSTSADRRRSKSMVGLSEAFVVPVTPEFAAKDERLQAQIIAEAGTHVFHYVSFACSFEPATNEPFDVAWVQVQFASDNGDAPIAYSLEPRALFDKAEISTTAKIGAELQFISAGAEASISQEARSNYLLAHRERHPNPYWELCRTATAEIEGSFVFHIIARSKVGAFGNGELTVSGTISKTQFLILTSREDIQSPPPVSFNLS